MNPRQRRGVLFLVASAISGVIVFALMVSYVADVNGRVGALETVLRLKTELPALSPVTAQQVEQIRLPRRYVDQGAITNVEQLAGKVTASTIGSNTTLVLAMFVDQPRLNPGQREIAILIDAETGVAGQVHPGDLVDIYATFPPQGTNVPFARVVVANARVLSIGNSRTVDHQTVTGLEQGKAIPVTFALSKQASLDLALAESAATKVRLALIPPGDATGPGDITTVTPQGPVTPGKRK